MEKGCLSGVKPGRGTNRNEALHKQLNKIVSSCGYGVELAFALLTILFFIHNERTAPKAEARKERPIQDFADELQACTMTTETYGLTFDHIDTPESVSSKETVRMCFHWT